NLRKWIPGIGLIILTIALLIIFKSNKGNINNLVEEGRGALLSLYTDNLKPLISKTNLTNEDVLNFALYRNLPIDKDKKQVLHIENDSPEGEILQLKPSVWREDTDNYNRLIKYLDLSSDERDQLDSILNSHKDEIYQNILYNDNNTIAVNANLADLRKLILLDIVNFAQKANKEKSEEFAPIFLEAGDDLELQAALNDVKDEKTNDFIFIAPDTVFQVACNIDEAALEKSIVSYEAAVKHGAKALEEFKFSFNINIPEAPYPVDVVPVPEFSVMVNDNDSSRYVKIFIPKIGKKVKQQVVLDKYNKQIDSLNKRIERISSVHPGHKTRSSTRSTGSVNIPDEEPGDFNFEFNLDNLDELITNSIELGLKASNIEKWENFGIKVDSLMKSFQININDSSFKIDIENFKKEVQKLKEETEKNSDKKLPK
ncbi:MAG: hypothetical protein V1720_22350, partial [bacterium]